MIVTVLLEVEDECLTEPTYCTSPSSLDGWLGAQLVNPTADPSVHDRPPAKQPVNLKYRSYSVVNQIICADEPDPRL